MRTRQSMRAGDKWMKMRENGRRLRLNGSSRGMIDTAMRDYPVASLVCMFVHVIDVHRVRKVS